MNTLKALSLGTSFLDLIAPTPAEKAVSLVGPLLLAAACLLIAVFLFFWLKKRKK